MYNNNPYFKAKFTGLFKINTTHSSGIYIFSDIQWTYLNISDCKIIENFEPLKQKTGDFWYKEKINENGFNWFRPKTNIIIPKSIQDAYHGNIYNVLIRNIKINKDKTHFLNRDWFEASGDIYFLLSPFNPTKKPLINEKNKFNFNSNDVKTPINNIVSGTNVIQNYIQSDTTSHNLPVDIIEDNSIPAQKSNNSNFLKWIGLFFGFFLYILFLISLWSSSKILFAILLFTGLSWVLSRLFNISLLKIILNIVFLFILFCFIITFFYKTSTTKKPIKTRTGNIKISPPILIKDSLNNGLSDYLTEKDIKWFDFINLDYQAKYQTSIRSYQNSKKEQDNLNTKVGTSSTSVDFFTKFYAGLYEIDQKKVDNVVKIFKDSATSKKMNSNQIAEMVTTFIQEIPYYLVHDETCAKAVANGDSFIKQYHALNKPCLPNVKGGVQSPYEFLHNLKGDCDTRSLLGFAILKKLNIASSVWVSEVYGHSILGVGVPNGHGFYKIVNGVKHYGVELTAKGYRIGMVAPENNNPNNWEITIYNNY